MNLMFGSCRVVRFICLSNKNWKRDKSESEAWKIGAEISAVPSVFVFRRVIPFLFLAAIGESNLLVWLSFKFEDRGISTQGFISGSVLPSSEKWSSRSQQRCRWIKLFFLELG